ncbi:TPA: polysaccharide biosynthesis tyrosine autokinase [Staphylococcus aureus]|nr:polysaccharide biosynthesis tyrosine autokinase [Staphylococcus aureus]
MSKKENTTTTLFVYEKPKSTISEKFRGIRSNIMFSKANGEVKRLLVTSEKPGAGKSTVVSNVAITYAQAGYKTLVIDGDMRKPTQNYIFNEQNNNGLSSLIIGRTTMSEAITSTEIENLDLLTAGPVPPNPSELIGSERFKELVDLFNKRYDIIIVDTPPVNTVTDAQLYARAIKDSLLVIDSEKNDKNEVKKAKALMEKAGSNILGVILNKTKVDKSSSYYHYTTPIEKVKSCLNHIESLEEVQALNLKFYYGQEIRITDQILNDIDRKVINGINDSRYLLIEFPSNEVPHYTDQLFFELQSKGFVPIIAHPERNKAISQNLDILYDLINKGALSQVTTASLAGISGKKIRKLAIQMIENNLTHFIGSDAHNTEIRPFLMKDLFNDKKLRDYYEDMNGFISNAKLVVDDKKIPKRMPQQDYKQKRWFGL